MNTQIEHYLSTFKSILEFNRIANPNKYFKPYDVDNFINKIRLNILESRYNHRFFNIDLNSDSFKQTAKTLKIKNNPKSVLEFCFPENNS